VRLFLFDIDGTLISARGLGRAALKTALERVFGTAGAIDEYDLRGKTDPRILHDVLGAAGVPRAAIETRVAECFEVYVRELEARLGDGSGVRVMPGIAELVTALSARRDAVVGLLTGNIEPGARVKLRPTGLLPRFRVGAFGSDDMDRRRLPLIARERARRLTGHDFDFERVTIIGDTPLCARLRGRGRRGGDRAVSRGRARRLRARPPVPELRRRRSLARRPHVPGMNGAMRFELIVLWLHVLGAIVWVGGLMYQAHVLLPAARRGPAGLFADAARRGRPIAWTAIALVVLTGLYNVTRLGPVERVMESGTGLVLAAKFILVLAAVALAGQRDFAQLPRLARALAAREDPARALGAIAWLDRAVLLLAVVIVYLGLAISRAG